MVTRNRKFPTPPGYSRLSGRREAGRIVAEELEIDEVDRLSTQDAAIDRPQHARVVFGLAPPGMPRAGIDLSKVAPVVREPALPTRLQGLLQAMRRLGRRLFDWISWK